ncbi:hypothetical protein DB88DRAFT_478753 [Papiliotrema laurentii]|uniref:Mediator of RNA polymerase II transcription subunit 21 n=1 Tax=Papiliotrema laurentii TaxID=5418 RepID=A0AAD9FWM6_PAPLA|nr:hypothetical protein DB88DRAFT_478753 [Papiliotrema laurentii]
MLSAELSTDMDRITQLQDAVLDLLSITHTAIEYITKRAQFEQTSLSIPTTLISPHAAGRKEYKEAIETFVGDIVKRSKDVERLIATLPAKDDNGQRATRIQELQQELEEVDIEYKAALTQAESLMKELEKALGTALGDERTTQDEETADA